SPLRVDMIGLSHRSAPTQRGQYTRVFRPSMPSTKAAPHLPTDVVTFTGYGSLDNISPKVERSVLVSRTIAVSTHDMCAEPTSTPWWATSSRSAFANCSTAALLALYGASPGAAVKAASDDTT